MVQMVNTLSTVQATRKHFLMLDGFRGVAALAVVIFHFAEMVLPPVKNFIAHGFLAVDFFFCLSGFVIGYAYDDRLKALGLKRFAILRLIRLHPLVVLGAILGLLAFVLDPFANYSSNYSIAQLFLLFIFTALLIPYPIIAERSFNTFCLNAPAWSLFWEYIANIVYALLLVRLNKVILWCLMAAGAVLVIYFTRTMGDISGGWSKDNFWIGGVRILYSFTAGLLIYRGNMVIKNRLPFILLAALLFMAFLIPYTPRLNYITEPLIVLFFFPLMVMLGRGSNAGKFAGRASYFLGNLSYPLYMTHYAVIWIFHNYTEKYRPSGQEIVLIVFIAVPLLVLLGVLASKYYDEPVRKWLTRRLLPRRTKLG